MRDSVHLVSGRVRLRSRRLKRNESRVRRLCKLLEAHGQQVVRYHVRPITGTATIWYDPKVTRATQLLDLLAAHGFVDIEEALDLHAPITKPAMITGQILSHLLFGAMVEFVRKAGALRLLGIR